MNIQLRRVFNLHPFTVSDVPDSRRLRFARNILSSNFAQPHAPLDNSFVPSQIQLKKDLLRKLLLGELHLRLGVLHRFTADLPGQVHQLLGARRQPRRLAQDLALGPLQPLHPRLLSAHVQRARDLPDHHLALPPPATPRIRVHDMPHMLWVGARAHSGLGLAPSDFLGHKAAAGIGLVLGDLAELVLEYGRRVQHSLRHASAQLRLDFFALLRFVGFGTQAFAVQILGLVPACHLPGFIIDARFSIGGRRPHLRLQKVKGGCCEGWAEGFEDRRSCSGCG